MDELYHIRMRRAVIASVLLHLLLLLPITILERRGGPGPSENPAPIVMRFEEEEPPQRRQLVDVTQPSPSPPEQNTDLIAEANSEARDAVLREGQQEGPQVQEEDDFDSLAMRRPVAPPIPPAPLPPPVPESAAEETPEAEAEAEEEDKTQEEPQEDPDYVEAPPKETVAAEEAPAQPTPPVPGEETEEDAELRPPAPLQMAQAETSGQAEMGSDRLKGRTREAVRQKGFTNFEAIADQVAPYLKQIKLRVERRWNEALLHRYSGLTPTEAVIQCSISPDGRVVSATITGGPRDPIYAALCRKAVFDAGPFGPFPFEVPDIYRNQNLEIRWTFSFL